MVDLKSGLIAVDVFKDVGLLDSFVYMIVSLVGVPVCSKLEPWKAVSGHCMNMR